MWNDLTMSERADVIKMAVKAGLRDMKSIRDFYDNSLKYADGGPKATYGKPYYSYDKNMQIETDNGKPILNYSATLPEVNIIPDSKKSPADRNEARRFREKIFSDNAEREARDYTQRQIMKSQRDWDNSLEKKALGYAQDAMTGIGIGADIVSGLPIYSSLKGARVLSEANSLPEYIEGGLWLAPIGGVVGKEAYNVGKNAWNTSKNIKYSISLEDALSNPNFDFSSTGAPRSFWEIMNLRRPSIASEKWKKVANQKLLDSKELDGAVNILQSTWYKKRLLSQGMSEAQANNLINQQVSNIKATNVILGDPGTGFGMQAGGKTVTVNGKTTIYVPEGYTSQVTTHEGLHSSTGNGSILDIKNKVLTPNWSRETNPNYYDYISNPDEQRVRLLKLADYVEQHGGDYVKVISDLKSNSHGIGKPKVDSDFNDLFGSFNIGDIIEAAKNVKSIAVPLTIGGTALSNQYAEGGPKVSRPRPAPRPAQNGNNRFANMSDEETEALGKDVEEYWKQQEEELKNRTPEQVKQMGIEADRKWKQKYPNGSESSPRVQKVANTIMSALSNSADSLPFTGDAVIKAAEDQRQEKINKWHEYRNGIDSFVTGAELLAAGYGVGRGLAHLERMFARKAATSSGQAISREALERLSKWNKIVKAVDKRQVLMNGVGGIADGYQWITANNSFDRWENGIETGSNVAGVIGGMNWFRDFPYLRSIGGRKIDSILDTFGYSAAAWDVVKNLPPLSDALDGIRRQTTNTEENKKAEGGSIHIAPSKRGTFTAAATKHGMGVQEFASKVLANKDNYSSAMVKKANFAKNASKWNHGLGGYLFENGGPKNTNREYKSANSWSPSNLHNILTPVSTALMNFGKHGGLTDIFKGWKGGTPEETYFLPKRIQRQEFLSRGYTEAPNDYGLVKKAVNNRDIPVYQLRADDISREKVIPISNINDKWFGKDEAELEHPGHYPTAVYYSPYTNEYYQKGWDLNDYGGGTGAYNNYPTFGKIKADIADTVGSPVVTTTGISRIGSLADMMKAKDTKDIAIDFLNSKGLVPMWLPTKELPVLNMEGKPFYDLEGKPFTYTVNEFVPSLPEITITGKRRKKVK